MRIGARQAAEIRAEPAAHARDEETHAGRDGWWLLRAVGLRPQQDAADREASNQDSCPSTKGIDGSILTRSVEDSTEVELQTSILGKDRDAPP